MQNLWWNRSTRKCIWTLPLWPVPAFRSRSIPGKPEKSVYSFRTGCPKKSGRRPILFSPVLRIWQRDSQKPWRSYRMVQACLGKRQTGSTVPVGYALYHQPVSSPKHTAGSGLSGESSRPGSVVRIQRTGPNLLWRENRQAGSQKIRLLVSQGSTIGRYKKPEWSGLYDGIR